MNGEEIIQLVEAQYEGMRIDKYISIVEENISRSFTKKLIEEKLITVNQKIIKANYTITAGDKVTYFIPEPINISIEPENIPVDILYEDQDIIVVNKSKGMVVHPAAGHYNGTLVNALLYHCKDSLSGINGCMRPGIVHRIDMDTTGVLVACKNDTSHRFISEQLKVHSITRKYNALVYGSFSDPDGRINNDIGRHPVDRKKMAVTKKNGKSAVTYYHVLESFQKKYAHVECSLETGRTHQIRVHMSSIHHPLLGDDVYGPMKNEFKLQGQALHARLLGFMHPTTKKYVEFEAPLPDYFLKLMDRLRSLTT